MATNSCVTPIRSLSIFSVCDEYTAEKMLPLIEGCTLDIQVRWSMLSVGRKQLISFQLWQNWICPADGHFDPFRWLGDTDDHCKRWKAKAILSAFAPWWHVPTFPRPLSTPGIFDFTSITTRMCSACTSIPPQCGAVLALRMRVVIDVKLNIYSWQLNLHVICPTSRSLPPPVLRSASSLHQCHNASAYQDTLSGSIVELSSCWIEPTQVSDSTDFNS